MSLRDPYRRRRQSVASPLRWLLIGVAVVACVAFGVLIHAVWQRSVQSAAEDIHQAGLEALQSDIQVVGTRLAGLENRLVALESSNLGGQLASVQANVDGIKADVAGLARRVDALASGSGNDGSGDGTLPPEAQLVVARQTQSHSLSCESSASSMAAQYQGVPVTEEEIVAALPRNDNPHLGFRGNIDGPYGSTDDYGVYAEPVLQVLNSRGLGATLIDGGLDGIKWAIARGNPVVAWVTYNCSVQTPVVTTIGGQEVTLVPYEHVVVVTGYNDNGVWANDPYDGQEHFYATADFQRALGYFGNMAIEVAAP
jgi:uncharacterized protein YvpB